MSVWREDSRQSPLRAAARNPGRHSMAAYAWRALLYFLPLFVFSLGMWLRTHFDQPTLQQIVYHLYFLESLAFDSNNVFVVTFALQCLLIPALVAYLCVVLERAAAALWARRSGTDDRSAVRPLPPIVRRSLTHLPLLALTVGLLSLGSQVSAFAYLRSQIGPDHFASRYVPPDEAQLRARTLKNLVLVYVESLETTYSNHAIFGRDLLADVNALPGVSFDRYLAAPGTGWTMGAIVATQCGVPLQFVTRADPRETGETVAAFLPGAKCLGDVLKDFGYRNVFVGGAALNFAGKGAFLRAHHYDETYGYPEYLRSKIPLQRASPWGLFDDDLFAQARAKLVELQSSGEPFNLTVLTLDTHHPEGHYSKYCVDRGARNFEDIVTCTSRQVAEFVKFIADSGYLQTTNVVIVGDHLAMANPVYGKLQSARERTMFNKFISAELPRKGMEELLPFDLLPTIVEFIGIDIAGDRLGLGHSGFAPKGPAAAERLEATAEILNFSRTYESLWVPESWHE